MSEVDKKDELKKRLQELMGAVSGAADKEKQKKDVLQLAAYLSFFGHAACAAGSALQAGALLGRLTEMTKATEELRENIPSDRATWHTYADVLYDYVKGLGFIVDDSPKEAEETAEGPPPLGPVVGVEVEVLCASTPMTPATFEFVKPVVKIGRLRGSDIELDDGDVALMHGVIEIEEGGARYVDLGSTIGTRLGEHKVKRAAELHSGDTLHVGDYDLTVTLIRKAK